MERQNPEDVTIGETVGGQVEITSGLSAGDVVADEPKGRLLDGAPVRALRPGSDRGQTELRPSSDQGQTELRPGPEQGQSWARRGSAQHLLGALDG